MNPLKSLVCAFGLLGICSAAMASDTTYSYCSDLYPADSYEAEERRLYVDECIQANATDEELASPMFSGKETPDNSESDYADDSDNMETYEGTVEDFVEDSVD